MTCVVINKWRKSGIPFGLRDRRLVPVVRPSVDVMRPGPFGNPFKCRPYGPYSRGEAVLQFREWFFSNDPDAVEMRELALELIPQNSILLCCCKPKACHGDVIAEFINNHYSKVDK